jgi:DNA-binding transcriptional regulator LsrR (DeoR family)
MTDVAASRPVSPSARKSRPKAAFSISDEQLANLAEDYYLNDRTQEQIAARYGISRSYVSRLLLRARTLGIVEIIIHRDILRSRSLEAELERRFGLARCVVVESAGASEDRTLQMAGEAGADILAELLTPESTLALSWGNSVRAVVDAIRPGRTSARRVVQMFGGLRAAPAEIMSGELVTSTARQIGALEDRLHAPWIVETSDLARSLLDQTDVAATLRRAANADVAVVSVGAVGMASSAIIYSPRYLSHEDLEEISASGAIGDLCGRLYDANGRACRVPLMQRVISLDLDLIRQIPMVLCIATGRFKAPAILGALRGHLISGLVTDSEAAQAILASDL